MDAFENETLAVNQKLNIPTKTDGTMFELNDLKGCQEQIMAYVFKRLFKWINRTPQTKKHQQNVRGRDPET